MCCRQDNLKILDKLDNSIENKLVKLCVKRKLLVPYELELQK
jgi:hypothetical protein